MRAGQANPRIEILVGEKDEGSGWTQPTRRLILAPLGNSVRAMNKSISENVLCGPPLTKLPSFLHKAKGRERVSLTVEPRTVETPREKGVSSLLAPS